MEIFFILEIYGNIFGCRKGAILILRGLVDAASEEIFDTALRSLKSKWNLLEKDNISANATGFSFYEWFKFYKVSDSVVIIQTLCTNQN